MIKKIATLLLFTCFAFALNDIPAASVDVVDKKDKAEVKQIEQNIIKEKYDEAQKELELKRTQELQELKNY